MHLLLAAVFLQPAAQAFVAFGSIAKSSLLACASDDQLNVQAVFGDINSKNG
jgi:hypothetical protein